MIGREAGPCAWSNKRLCAGEKGLYVFCDRPKESRRNCGPSCPAFLSRDAAAKQERLIEAVDGIMEAAHLGWTIIKNEHPEYAECASFMAEKMAAVEDALRQMEGAALKENKEQE